MSYPEALYSCDKVSSIDTMDIREDSPAKYHCDFTDPSILLKNYYDLVITNPPFAIAKQIIEKSLEATKEGGHVVMLLRLNFFGSEERHEFFDEHMPVYCLVHRKRIAFIDGKYGGKGTDSIEYAHFVFKKGYNPEFTKLKII